MRHIPSQPVPQISRFLAAISAVKRATISLRVQLRDTKDRYASSATMARYPESSLTSSITHSRHLALAVTGRCGERLRTLRPQILPAYRDCTTALNEHFDEVRRVANGHGILASSRRASCLSFDSASWN